MANTLGQLVVKLGLDAAEFTSGLTKAEHEAQRFGVSLNRGIATAANLTVIAVSAIATAATAAFVAVDQLAKQAGNFKDLEEKTGASAESLASMSVAAKVAGTSMDIVAEASIRLTKGLTGVDDESKQAGAALAALGIPIKAFKALDPAKQLEAVAKALGGFQDGAGKTAVALALFGRAGAQLLPFLKELEQSGGRQVILTQRQIELADAYADAQARAKAQLNLYAQALATQALPAITAFTLALKDAIADLINIDNIGKKLESDNAIGVFAEKTAIVFAALVDQVDAFVRAFQVVGTVIGATVAQAIALSQLDISGYKTIQQAAKNDLDAILDRQSLVSRLEDQLKKQKNIAEGLKLIDPSNEDRLDRLAKKAQLVFSGPASGAGARAAAERQSEAERFLESLQKQLEKTAELTVVEQVLLDIQKQRIGGLTPKLQAEILAVAAQIDAANALKKALQEQEKVRADEARTRERTSQLSTKAREAALAETEQLAQQNRQIREETELIGKTAQQIAVINEARLDAVIATKQQALAAAQNVDGMEAEAASIQDQIRLLQERKVLLSDRTFAEQLAEDARQLQEFKNLFADTFADAFSSVVDGSKSASEAFKSFANSIVQQINRIAAQQLANALFGGTNGQFDLSKIVKSLIGSVAPGIGGNAAGAGAEAAVGNAAVTAGAVAAETALVTLAATSVATDASLVTMSAASVAADASLVAMSAASTASTGAVTSMAAAASASTGSITSLAASATTAAAGLSTIGAGVVGATAAAASDAALVTFSASVVAADASLAALSAALLVADTSVVAVSAASTASTAAITSLAAAATAAAAGLSAITAAGAANAVGATASAAADAALVTFSAAVTAADASLVALSAALVVADASVVATSAASTASTASITALAAAATSASAALATVAAAGGVAGAAGAAAGVADAALVALSATAVAVDASLVTLSATSIAADASMVAMSAASTVSTAAITSMAAAATAAAAALSTVAASSVASAGIGAIAGGFAVGGSPPVGRASLVGEFGPELFVPRVAGNIIPNSVLEERRAKSVTVNNYVTVPQSMSRPTRDQLLADIGKKTQKATARNA